MKKNFAITLVLALFSLSAQAQRAGQHIVVDGSVARCSEVSDHGSRAFTLKVVEVTQKSIKFEVENLVCILTKNNFSLKSFALSQAFEFKNDGHVWSYEYPKANMLVLNTEGTKILQAIAIDPNITSQEFVVDTAALDARIFDLSLQPLELIKVDGKVFDQGLAIGGSYRIRIK